MAALEPIMTAQMEAYSFRVYLTDAVRAQAQGKYLRERWADIIARPKHVDTRDPEIRLKEFIQQAGLKRAEGGNVE